MGGASGSLLAAYGIVPALGLRGTLLLGAGTNLLIGLTAVTMSRRLPRLIRSSDTGVAVALPPVDDVPREATLDSTSLLLLGGASGLLVFAAEVVFVHLLALVIGTSVYAFGLMLAIFLSCLGVGA